MTPRAAAAAPVARVPSARMRSTRASFVRAPIARARISGRSPALCHLISDQKRLTASCEFSDHVTYYVTLCGREDADTGAGAGGRRKGRL